MATEIVVFVLKEGMNPDDANSTAGKVMSETVEKILEQPGAQRVYWGREVENPPNLRLFVDWDTVEDHITFTKTDFYGPFVENFGKIVDLSKITMYHAPLKPHPPSGYLSKKTTQATEILVVYFPSDYSDADKRKFEEDFALLGDVVNKNSKHYTGSGGGWIVEEQPIPDAADGAKGKAFAGFIGWTSVQDHLDFRGTDAFKENIHLLRGAKDLKGVKVVHYSGNEAKKA